MMDTTLKEKKTKINYIALALWLFLGFFGAHRFYMNRNLSAVLMLLTGVGSLIWLYDLITYAIVYISYVFIEAGIVQSLYVFLLFFTALLAKGFIFIFIWWIIDFFFVIRFNPDNQ